MAALTPFRTALLEPPVPVSVSGDAAWTETGDTLAAAGTVTYVATGAWAETGDSLAAAGAVTYLGAAAWIETGDALAAAGAVTVTVGTVNLAVRALSRTTNVRGLTT